MKTKTTLFRKLEEALQDQIRINRHLGSRDLEECEDAIGAEAAYFGYYMISEEDRLVAIADLIAHLKEDVERIVCTAQQDTGRFEES